MTILVHVHKDLVSLFEGPLKDFKGQRIFNIALNGPLERTGPIGRIIAYVSYPCLCPFAYVNFVMMLLQTVLEIAELDIYNTLQVFLISMRCFSSANL